MGQITDMVKSLEDDFIQSQRDAEKTIEELESTIEELEGENEELRSNIEGDGDVRSYLTDTLSKLLCDRYNVSYHTNKQKLIDLVTQELNI